MVIVVFLSSQFKALMLKIDPDDDDDSDVEVVKKPFQNDANATVPNTRNLRGNQVSYPSVALCMFHLSHKSWFSQCIVL